MRLLTITLVLATTLVAAGTAGAEPPVIEPLASEPFVIEDSCPFPVLVEAIQEAQKVALFSSGVALVTGRLVVRVTNLADESHSLELEISGPAKLTTDEDGITTIRAKGTNLIWLWPTDAGGPAMFLNSGAVTLVNDADFNTLSVTTTGTRTDLCASLA
jgi:hypothetical protein